MTTQAMGPSFVRVLLEDLIAPRFIDPDLTVTEGVDSVYCARIISPCFAGMIQAKFGGILRCFATFKYYQSIVGEQQRGWVVVDWITMESMERVLVLSSLTSKSRYRRRLAPPRGSRRTQGRQRRISFRRCLPKIRMECHSAPPAGHHGSALAKQLLHFQFSFSLTSLLAHKSSWYIDGRLLPIFKRHRNEHLYTCYDDRRAEKSHLYRTPRF